MLREWGNLERRSLLKMPEMIPSQGETGHIRPTATVFVVDDESIISFTIGEILGLSGFNAFSFVSPLAAIEAAKESTPNLLITDVMMAELSGVELAIEFKMLCPGCQVLLFSGQAATADLLAQAREQGHDFELLTKPFHPTVLVDRVKAITTTL